MKFTALAALALPLLANAKGPALGPDGAELRGDPSRPNTVIENGPPGTVSLKPLCSGRGENGIWFLGDWKVGQFIVNGWAHSARVVNAGSPPPCP